MWWMIILLFILYFQDFSVPLAYVQNWAVPEVNSEFHVGPCSLPF
jgi:hypothetical protein